MAVAPRTVSLRLGHTVTLSAMVWDALGEPISASDVSWRSLAPTLASVDASGVVRALADGHARIAASIEGVSDSITVDVLP